MHAITINTL